MSMSTLQPVDRVHRLLVDNVVTVAFGLTGSLTAADVVTADAVRQLDPASDSARRLHAATGFVIDECVGDRVPVDPNSDFADHRHRLRRDLARHDSATRVLLALRHLAGVPVDQLAVRLGVDTRAVVAASRRWMPDDSDPQDTTMIESLDRWLSGAAAASPPAAPHPLSRLVQPAAGRIAGCEIPPPYVPSR